MNEGNIWWSQVGSSIRLLNSITLHLRESISAVMWIPTGLPWSEIFYHIVNLRRSEFSSGRHLCRVGWRKNEDPDQFVLEEFCEEDVRVDYWPSISRAKYMAGRADLSLHDDDIWVTGITTQTDLFAWMQFIAEYNREAEAAGRKNHAMFVLEYSGAQMETPGLTQFNYRIRSLDCRVFCLETAAAMESAELPSYQAELALWIGDGNPERSAVLLNQGQTLLETPVETALQALEHAVDSRGAEFPPLTEQEIVSAVWKTENALLYPLLEEFRMDFIAAHEAELQHYLPITNSNGEKVTDPYELELGALSYIYASHQNTFTAEEGRRVTLARRLRNLLAHNDLVAYREVKKILKD